jgi:dolichol-phosphate mannosyltransferase
MRIMPPAPPDATPPPHDDRGVSVSLLLPAWNEADSIARTVAGMNEALTRVVATFEILVIDDGGRDGTSPAVRALSAKNPAVRLVHHEPNRGYGAALKSGFVAAACDLVVFADAACQFDVARLDRLAILSRAYDIVSGYGAARKEPPLRAIYFRLFNQLVAALRETDVRQAQRGLKLFHRESLLNLTPLDAGQGADFIKLALNQRVG